MDNLQKLRNDLFNLAKCLLFTYSYRIQWKDWENAHSCGKLLWKIKKQIFNHWICLQALTWGLSKDFHALLCIGKLWNHHVRTWSPQRRWRLVFKVLHKWHWSNEKQSSWCTRKKKETKKQTHAKNLRHRRWLKREEKEKSKEVFF